MSPTCGPGGSSTARSPRGRWRSSSGSPERPRSGAARLPVVRGRAPPRRAVLPRVRDAAGLRPGRHGRRPAAQRGARAGAQGARRLSRGAAGPRRVGTQPGRGRAGAEPAAGGGHPVAGPAHRRLRRARLPGQRPARHPRPGRRSRGGAGPAARRSRPSAAPERSARVGARAGRRARARDLRDARGRRAGRARAIMARMLARNPRDGAPVTLRDVARLAGVHPGTVSRALNPATEGLVNDETVRRVRDAAAELGYRPNPMARGLKTNRTYTIGVLIPDIQNPLFPPIIRGIDDRLGSAGYTPLIANTDNDPQRERNDVEAMRTRQVDGFITATARRDHELLDEVARLEAPVVLVNRRTEDDTLPSATADDRDGVRLAVAHLVELGHRRIGAVAGPQDLSTGLHRHEGFLAALAGHGLERERVGFGSAFTEREGARVCEELLAVAPDVTAIVAGNDLMALGCYDVLAERGLACPGQVSIVGFNDMPFAGKFNPPLTTVRIPHYEIGAAAADLLLERLADPAAAPRHVMLAPEFVVRGSTAPAA